MRILNLAQTLECLCPADLFPEPHRSLAVTTFIAPIVSTSNGRCYQLHIYEIDKQKNSEKKFLSISYLDHKPQMTITYVPHCVRQVQGICIWQSPSSIIPDCSLRSVSDRRYIIEKTETPAFGVLCCWSPKQ